jgi:hypothetical protein
MGNNNIGHYHLSYRKAFVMNKNQYRYIKKTDTIEGRKWYHDLFESIKEDIDTMVSMIIGEDSKKSEKEG